MDGPSLTCGKLALTLAPGVGGSIARFDWRDGNRVVPILRGTDRADATVLDMASFPLVPYVNRIRGGRFTFRGREVRIAPNMAGDISPLHGQGWLEPMAGRRGGCASRPTLSFRHEPGEWPWAIRGDPALRARRKRFDAVADLPERRRTNRCRAASASIPISTAAGETRLDTQVTHAWTIDEHVLPIERVPATGRFDLSDRPVCGQGLDHGFGGWNGTARMTDPGWPFALEMSFSRRGLLPALFAGQRRHLRRRAGDARQRRAQCAGGRIGRSLGMRVLEPGEAMRLDMRIDVEAG